MRGEEAFDDGIGWKQGKENYGASPSPPIIISPPLPHDLRSFSPLPSSTRPSLTISARPPALSSSGVSRPAAMRPSKPLQEGAMGGERRRVGNSIAT